jgi:hypothetical protein
MLADHIWADFGFQLTRFVRFVAFQMANKKIVDSMHDG